MTRTNSNNNGNNNGTNGSNPVIIPPDAKRDQGIVEHLMNQAGLASWRGDVKTMGVCVGNAMKAALRSNIVTPEFVANASKMYLFQAERALWNSDYATSAVLVHDAMVLVILVGFEVTSDFAEAVRSLSIQQAKLAVDGGEFRVAHELIERATGITNLYAPASFLADVRGLLFRMIQSALADGVLVAAKQYTETAGKVRDIDFDGEDFWYDVIDLHLEQANQVIDRENISFGRSLVNLAVDLARLHGVDDKVFWVRVRDIKLSVMSRVQKDYICQQVRELQDRARQNADRGEYTEVKDKLNQAYRLAFKVKAEDAARETENEVYALLASKMNEDISNLLRWSSEAAQKGNKEEAEDFLREAARLSEIIRRNILGIGDQLLGVGVGTFMDSQLEKLQSRDSLRPHGQPSRKQQRREFDRRQQQQLADIAAAE